MDLICDAKQNSELMKQMTDRAMKRVREDGCGLRRLFTQKGAITPSIRLSFGAISTIK